MVNPAHVHRSKELDDNLPTKHDVKDALVIARLAKDGRFSFLRLLYEIEADLRVGSTLREKLRKEQTAVLNAIIRWTDRHFPEFSTVFRNLGKMALAVLELTPFPGEITGRTVEELVKVYRYIDKTKDLNHRKNRKSENCLISRAVPLLSCCAANCSKYCLAGVITSIRP